MNQQLIFSDLEAKIANFGFAQMGILPEIDSPPFNYTVGMLSKRLPELIIAGLDNKTAHQIVNTVAEKLIGGVEVVDGMHMSEVITGYDVRLTKTDPDIAKDCATFAKKRADDFGQSYVVYQIEWPDRHGKFPGEKGVIESVNIFQTLLPIAS